VHPGPEVTSQGHPLRQVPLQKAQPDRDHVGRLKDWRRIATRYDRCPKVFLSAIALAATVMFWL
jgi:transposase